MGTGIHKKLRRQDITFEDKDQSLRDDVRTLGAMVGELIREQSGDELYDFVETARLRAIRRREDNEVEGEDLASLVEGLEPELALQLIRSFSTYFQMVNTAEKVHRIRRRMEYLRDADENQIGRSQVHVLWTWGRVDGGLTDPAADGVDTESTPITTLDECQESFRQQAAERAGRSVRSLPGDVVPEVEQGQEIGGLVDEAGVGRIRCRPLSCIRGVFLRPSEPGFSRRCPRDHMSLFIAKRNDDIIKRRLDIGNSFGLYDHLPLLGFSGFQFCMRWVGRNRESRT